MLTGVFIYVLCRCVLHLCKQTNTQPSALCGTVTWVSLTNSDGWIFHLYYPTGILKVKLQLGLYELAATQRRPTVIQVTQVNSRHGFTVTIAL